MGIAMCFQNEYFTHNTARFFQNANQVPLKPQHYELKGTRILSALKLIVFLNSLVLFAEIFILS